MDKEETVKEGEKGHFLKKTSQLKEYIYTHKSVLTRSLMDAYPIVGLQSTPFGARTFSKGRIYKVADHCGVPMWYTLIILLDVFLAWFLTSQIISFAEWTCGYVSPRHIYMDSY